MVTDGIVVETVSDALLVKVKSVDCSVGLSVVNWTSVLADVTSVMIVSDVA